MRKYSAKVSAVFLLFLMAIFWTATVSYNVRAIPRGTVGDVRAISMTSNFLAQTDQMFTVTGGPIEIVSLFGHCTVDVASDPGNLIVQLDGTSGDDLTFNSVASSNALNAGDIVRFPFTMDEGATDVTANVGAGQPLSWYCFPGEIEQYCLSTGTGNIVWYMSYRRLDPSSRVSISTN